MNSDRQRLIEAIHASPQQMVIAVTGGGASALSDMLAVPGASRSILEARVPYSPVALADWLSDSPQQSCSEFTARAMAMAALERARELSSSASPRAALLGEGPDALLGIGATAALASDRPKRGEHRIHVAWQSLQSTATLSLTLEKDARGRREEENVARDLVLLAIAEACGLVDAFELTLREGEEIVRDRVDAPAAWQELAFGERQSIELNFASGERPAALFPGAFNPLHGGHRAMARLAEQMLGKPIAYEISVANVDKRPLDYVDIAERVAEFERTPLVLSRVPTFVQKAELYPGVKFVLGADTMERIGQLRYYDGEEQKRDAAVRRIAELGCQFLVFGREVAGEFQTLRELQLPSQLRKLCVEIPESQFRSDISSTELRKEGEN